MLVVSESLSPEQSYQLSGAVADVIPSIPIIKARMYLEYATYNTQELAGEYVAPRYMAGEGFW